VTIDELGIPAGSIERSVLVDIRFDAEGSKFPREVAAPLDEAENSLRPKVEGWSFWVIESNRTVSYDISNSDFDMSDAVKQIADGWDSGSNGPHRWQASGWIPVDTGSSEDKSAEPGILLIDYRPGPLNYTENAVPTEEIISMFAPGPVEAGRLSPKPRRRSGGKGGAGPIFTPIEVEIIAVATLAIGAYASSILAAAGKDTWEAIKRGVQSLRNDHRKEVRDARVSLVVRVRNGWVFFEGSNLNDEALSRLDWSGLPPLPDGEFEWVLEWQPARQQWVLLLDRHMAADS